MLDHKMFFRKVDGFSNLYSSFALIDTNVDDVINSLIEIDPKMSAGSGRVEDHCLYFVVPGVLPDLVYNLTAKLHCKGFADTGAWYGDAYFIAAYDGKDTDEYSAEWSDNCPEYNEDDLWDAFVKITDPKTGTCFLTGDGAIPEEQLSYWRDMVRSH